MRSYGVLHKNKRLPGFQRTKLAVNCHHNYVMTRSALTSSRPQRWSAGEDELGIIPGSMGMHGHSSSEVATLRAEVAAVMLDWLCREAT